MHYPTGLIPRLTANHPVFVSVAAVFFREAQAKGFSPTHYLQTLQDIRDTDVAHHLYYCLAHGRLRQLTWPLVRRFGLPFTSFDGAAPYVPEAFLHRQKHAACSAPLKACDDPGSPRESGLLVSGFDIRNLGTRPLLNRAPSPR